MSAQYEIEPLTVTMAGAVAMTGISKSEIYRLLADGRLTAMKQGRTILISVAVLRAYLERLPAAEFRRPGDK